MDFRSLLCILRVNQNFIYIFGVWKMCENYMGRLLGACSLFSNFLGIFLGLESVYFPPCVQ